MYEDVIQQPVYVHVCLEKRGTPTVIISRVMIQNQGLGTS